MLMSRTYLATAGRPETRRGTTYLDLKITDDFQISTLSARRWTSRASHRCFRQQGPSLVEPLTSGRLTRTGFAPPAQSAHIQSRTNFARGEEPPANIDSYTTLDLRLAVRTADVRLSVAFWVINLTNRHYWTNVIMPLDAIARFASMPATYGVMASQR